MPQLGEQAGQTARSFIEGMKTQPLSFALIALNLCFLVMFWAILTKVVDRNQKRETDLLADNREVRAILQQCVVPRDQPK